MDGGCDGGGCVGVEGMMCVDGGCGRGGGRVGDWEHTNSCHDFRIDQLTSQVPAV